MRQRCFRSKQSAQKMCPKGWKVVAGKSCTQKSTGKKGKMYKFVKKAKTRRR